MASSPLKYAPYQGYGYGKPWYWYNDAPYPRRIRTRGDWHLDRRPWRDFTGGRPEYEEEEEEERAPCASSTSASASSWSSSAPSGWRPWGRSVAPGALGAPTRAPAVPRGRDGRLYPFWQRLSRPSAGGSVHLKRVAHRVFRARARALLRRALAHDGDPLDFPESHRLVYSGDYLD